MKLEAADFTGVTCEGTAVDYPTAWKVARSVPFDEHHMRCSYRTQAGGMLCDCHVLYPEQLTRLEPRAAGPSRTEVRNERLPLRLPGAAYASRKSARPRTRGRLQNIAVGSFAGACGGMWSGELFGVIMGALVGAAVGWMAP